MTDRSAPRRLHLGRLPAPLRRRRMRPVVRRFSKGFSWIDRLLTRATHRSIGGWVAGNVPVLVLITVGCRSGKQRSTPLLYHRDEDGSWVVVAVNGTADWDPDWLRNLAAQPEAEIEVDGGRHRVTADVLSGPLRDSAWAAASGSLPGLATAQAACRRTIPVVRLRPSG